MAFIDDLKCWSGANPQFLEGKTRANQGYSQRLGLPLGFLRNQRTSLHQTNKCGY